VRPVAKGHERTGKRLIVDCAANLHPASGSEELRRRPPFDARPGVRAVGALAQPLGERDRQRTSAVPFIARDE
jgi:hypothetical protein